MMIIMVLLLLYQLLQVQFMYASTVLAIQTKGRGGYNQWVNSFRLEYSLDCATFNSLLNADGNNHVSVFLFWLRNHLQANY